MTLDDIGLPLSRVIVSDGLKRDRPETGDDTQITFTKLPIVCLSRA